MKNTTIAVIGLLFVVIVGLACSRLNPFSEQRPAANSRASANSNRSLSDTAVDTVTPEQQLGIPECDEVMQLITKFAENPEDGIAMRMAKSLVVSRIKEAIKTSIEENKTDKVQLAKDCKDAKAELQKAIDQWERSSANK